MLWKLFQKALSNSLQFVENRVKVYNPKSLSVNGKMILMNYNGLSLMSLFYHRNKEKSSFSSELSFHNCTYLWKFLTLFLINMTISSAPLLLCSIMTKCLLPTSCKPDFYFNFFVSPHKDLTGQKNPYSPVHHTGT